MNLHLLMNKRLMIKEKQVFRIAYLGNALIKLIAIIDREGGKKLPSPMYKFEQLKCGSLFTCRHEDVQRSFKFKDWILVTLNDNGEFTDV